MTELITLPGYSGSRPDHWQSLWELANPGIKRFTPESYDPPELENWIAALEQAVSSCQTPPILIAHSLSCLLVAHWATSSQQKIAGAFLVGAPDPDGPKFPEPASSFKQLPTDALPFPSLMIASLDDPYGTIGFQRSLARQWQAELIEVGKLGHINSDSNLGDWPQGFQLLQDFITKTLGK